MSYNRRKFIRKVGGLAGATALSGLTHPITAQNIQSAVASVATLSPEECARDEEFWYQIRQAYTVSPGLMNLNNGGVSPSPKMVQESVEYYNRMSNDIPTVNMWQAINGNKEPIRRDLANIAGCPAEEIAIVRNASEALETVIFGLRLNKGDEVIATLQDYPSMINAWKQRAHRDGIEMKWLNFEFPIEDKQLIIDQFVNAFTPKTKVVHLTHIVNWNGQVMPVKEIAAIAHSRGIEVVIDAAHSFAQMDFRVDELNCDYLGTSLHKWLCAPFGTGMLYVRKEKIKNLYPLFAAPDPEDEHIQKFENLGTRSLAVEQAIGQAIIFHEMIGIKRKEARLRFLKQHWAEQLAQIPGVHLYTSLKPAFSCGIGLFGVEGKLPGEIRNWLLSEKRIHTVAIDWENIQGVRVTPNIYTLLRELDTFVESVEEYVALIQKED